VGHFQTLCEHIPPMTKRCIPSCRPTKNRSITYLGRKQSSIQTTDTCSSYRHKQSCQTITIINDRHTCNSSIWTLSVRRETPIMLSTSSVDYLSWLWQLCSTLVGTRLQGGHIFTRVIQNFTAHTINSWKASKFQIFTSKMYCYATWCTSMFLKERVPRWFGRRTTVGSLEILR